jgi:hypothetical protein
MTSQRGGLGDFHPWGEHRSKADVVSSFDEAIARLERALVGDLGENRVD